MKAAAPAIAAVAGLVFLSACGDGGAGPPPRDEAPAPALTAEIAEREPPDRSDVTLVDNLLARVDAREWTLGEGLVATLALFVGERDAADVLRHGSVMDFEGTGIIEMAYEYLDDGPDAEAKAEITRLLDLLVFSNGQLESMAGLGAPAAALPGHAARGGAGVAEEDCRKFFHGAQIPGVDQCLEFQSITIDGKVYRVFYPAAGLPDAGWTEAYYKLALDAMGRSARTYGKLGQMLDVNLVFSAVAAQSKFGLGALFANAWVEKGKPCGVAVYVKMQELPDDDFKQTIAHELAHCFSHRNFPEQNSVKLAIRRWREEGVAEHFSNLVFPTNNQEFRWLEFLERDELSTTLFDRAYENFVFFQYMSNRRGDQAIVALVKTLPKSGGRPEQEAALARYPGIFNLHQDFVKALTDDAVDDSGIGIVPYEISDKNRLTFKISGPYSLKADVEPFGVLRIRFDVDPGKQACLNWSGEALLVESRPTEGDEEDWSEPPEILPEGAGQEGDETLVVTATRPGDFTAELDPVQDLVSSEALACECIVGTWVVNNDDVRRLRAARTGDVFDVSVGGRVTAIYDEDGNVTFEFDGWEIREVTDVGDASISTVNRTRGTAKGPYETIDGELRLPVRFDTEVTVTTVQEGEVVPGIRVDPLTTTLPPDAARVYVIPPVAAYQCSRETLIIPWQQGEDVTWTRVE